MLHQPLIDALTQHLRDGHDEAYLKQQTLEAGYDEATYQQAIAIARQKVQVMPKQSPSPATAADTGVTAPTAAPLSPPSPQEARPAAATDTSASPAPVSFAKNLSTNEEAGTQPSTSTPTGTSVRRFPFIIKAIGGLFILMLIGAVAFAMLSETSPFRSLSNLFSAAPYTEENFILGIGQAIGEMKSAAFALSVESSFAPREPDVRALPSADTTVEAGAIEAFGGAELLQDAKVSLNVSGDYDVGQIQNLSTKNQVQVAVELQDFSLGADFESMVIGSEGFYVRLNYLDLGFFSLFVPNLGPIEGQWVQLGNTSDLERFNEFSQFEQRAVYEGMHRVFEIVFQAAAETGVIALTQSPEKITYQDETAYRYRFHIVPTAVEDYLYTVEAKLVAEFGEDFSAIQNFAEIHEELDVAYFEYLNDYVSYSVVVGSDGTLLAYEGVARLAMDDPSLQTLQTHSTATLAFSQHNEVFEYDPPQPFLTSSEAGELVPFLSNFSSASHVEGSSELEDYLKQNREFLLQLINSQQVEYDQACFRLREAYDSGEIVNPAGLDEPLRCKQDRDSFSLEISEDELHYCVDSDGFNRWHSIPMMTGASCVYIPADVFSSAQVANDDPAKGGQIYNTAVKPLAACGEGNRLFMFSNNEVDSMRFDGLPSEYEFHIIESGGYIVTDLENCRADHMVLINADVFAFSTGGYVSGQLCQSTGVVATEFGRDDIFECELRVPEEEVLGVQSSEKEAEALRRAVRDMWPEQSPFDLSKWFTPW